MLIVGLLRSGFRLPARTPLRFWQPSLDVNAGINQELLHLADIIVGRFGHGSMMRRGVDLRVRRRGFRMRLGGCGQAVA
jgi:hypothetical protein